MTVTRLLSLDDAEGIAAVLAANREFLAPWEPLHTDDFCGRSRNSPGVVIK